MAITKISVPTTPANTGLYRRAMKSARASPIAVVRILMIQKNAVIRYGTLLAPYGAGSLTPDRRS